MAISPVSGQTAGVQASQGNQDYASQIKALQKQVQDLEKKVSKLQQDTTTSAEQKEQQVQAYEAQIEALEARIQMLEKKQAEAARGAGLQGAAVTAAAGQTAGAAGEESAEPAAEGVDIKI
jgi:archaellum component FlaC